MDNTDSCIPLSEIHIQSPFGNLFPKRQHVMDGLKKHMQHHGFDDAFPLILAQGPWTDHDVLIDGHCRRQVCEELGIETVPVVRRYFETEEAALEYMIHVQKDRRNLTDAEILNCVATLDARKDPCFYGNQHVPGLAQRCATPPSGKSAEKTAEALGISVRKVEQVRTVLAHAGEEMKQAIRLGQKSVNKAYKEIQVQRKENEENLNGTVMDATAAVADEVSLSTPGDAPVTETPELEAVHLQAATQATDPSVDQLELLVGASREANGWAHTVITGFDSSSIDYIIVGQGTPPATINGNQQIFMAPRTGTGRCDPNIVAKNPAIELPSGPPRTGGPVNLTHYGAEGWYEREKLGAQQVLGCVPEPLQGEIAKDTVRAAGALPVLDTDSPSGTLRNAAETEQMLDPHIIKILDLKLREGSRSTVVRFLEHLGMLSDDSTGVVAVDRDALLRYVCDRDANTLEGFTRLLSEFQEPPDTGLSADDACDTRDADPENPQEQSNEDFQVEPEVAMDIAPEHAGKDDLSPSEHAIGVTEQNDDPAAFHFDDPHLELLIDQIEKGQKQGARVFRWFKAENLLTYWPPEDRYRVERHMLRKKVKNLHELNAILTAPVMPEYEWFVTEFLEVCGDNGYEAQDASQALAFEINMALDSMLRRSYQGRSEWTVESMKAQMRMMIENWPQITSKSGLEGLVEQPPAPTLEFFVTNRAAWQAAREKYIDENESKVLRMLGIG